MNYLGDFAEDATVRIPFNTFSSNDPQASVTITNLADADIMVHKDGGTTQIVTDGATIAIDFDGITGNHLITIDTSVHADYSTGSDYTVRIEGTTVDGGTINAWVGSFSIENRFNASDITASDVLAQINAALDTAIAELGVAAPAVTPTLRTAIMLMYMMARNQVDVDTTGTDALKVHNDAGTQITSKLVTDDGTDYSEAKMS